LPASANPGGPRATRHANGAGHNDKEVIIMEATIKDKANKAATTFLERKGYDILEEGWAHGTDAVDVIARDDEDMVFVDVLVKSAGLDMPEEKPDRGKFERIAAAYLAELGDEENFAVRYDMVSILVLSDSRALLRHHINALSAL
jgi:putative endonuclease